MKVHQGNHVIGFIVALKEKAPLGLVRVYILIGVVRELREIAFAVIFHHNSHDDWRELNTRYSGSGLTFGGFYNPVVRKSYYEYFWIINMRHPGVIVCTVALVNSIKGDRVCAEENVVIIYCKEVYLAHEVIF